MSIKVPFPHMSLNAEGVPWGPYKMWNTYIVASGTTVEHMLGWTAEVARTSPWKKLETVIFNSHGGPGDWRIGEWVKRSDVTKFEVLKGLVSQIWLCICSAGKYGGPGGLDGNLFCGEIARVTGAKVTAPRGMQKGEKDVPYGYIDDWEGDVVTYEPTVGAIINVQKFPGACSRYQCTD